MVRAYMTRTVEMQLASAAGSSSWGAGALSSPPTALGLVRDEVELPVDQDVLPQRARDRACGGGEAHAASTGPAWSAMTPSRNLPIAGAGWAPTKPVTGSPFAKTATVGMLWMP